LSEERQARDVSAIKFEQIEGKIDQSAAATIGSLLNHLERGHAVGSDAA
jgi:hypothetical protein